MCGRVIIVGGFDFLLNTLSEHYTSQLADLLDMYNIAQHVTGSTHVDGHILDLVLSRTHDGSVTSTVCPLLLLITFESTHGWRWTTPGGPQICQLHEV